MSGGARLFVHNLENSVRLPQTVEAVISLAACKNFGSFDILPPLRESGYG